MKNLTIERAKRIRSIGIAILIPVVLLAGLAEYRLEKERTRVYAEENAQAMTEVMADNLREDLEERAAVAQFLAELCGDEKNLWDKDVSNVVDLVMKRINGHNIKFIDQQYDKYNRNGELTENILNEEKSYVQQVRDVLEEKKEYSIFFSIDDETGMPKIRYIVPVRDGEHIKGVLSISLEHEEYEANFVDEYNGSDFRWCLVDSEGGIILRNFLKGDEAYEVSLLQWSPLEENETMLREILERLEQEESSWQIYDTDHRQILEGARLENTSWTLIMNCPESYFLGDKGEQLTENLVRVDRFLICLLLLLLLLTWFITEDMVVLFLKGQRAEEEANHAKNRLMAAQMRPHFLFNTLSSIREIVLEDPQYGSDLLYDYATFLRTQINMISEEKPEPFSMELNTIRAYCHIEEMRFGDSVQMHYDIQAENFTVPPLSIQPLVENAIKHGIMEKETRRGNVWLRTREEEKNWIIEVQDDGVGFDYEKIKEEIRSGKRDSHALANLVVRLQKQASAEVQFDSGATGTTVTVRLPRIPQNMLSQ